MVEQCWHNKHDNSVIYWAMQRASSKQRLFAANDHIFAWELPLNFGHWQNLQVPK
jgi:hypothetical protein